jgi:CubicO group peptidase (beta-lactamase class C family)
MLSRLLLVVVLLVPRLCFGQDVAKMDEAVQVLAKDGRFMGSVLVARGNQVLLSKGYGSANLEWAIPNDPTTKFRLGSLTKQFTAAAILLLEERGKLKIDDPVKVYLPDAPAAWDKVTIYHVLTHTSGIPSFTSFPDYRTTEATPSTPEQLVARFKDKPLEFVPGEKWTYSNSGYVLLGYLIEKISGEEYAKFIQANIFDPLGMKDSGYDSNSAVIPRRAAGYEPGTNGPVNTGFIHMSIPFSGGALYSTTEDLLRWEQGLFGGKLLKAESLQKMTTPFLKNYAFGLGVDTKSGEKVIAHGGGIEGFNTYLAYYPDDALTVVVLANLTRSNPDRMARMLGDLAHGKEVKLPTPRKVVTVPVEKLKEYVGTYALNPNFELAVTLEGEQLMTQATRQPKFPVFAESETKFFLKVVDAQIEFVRDAKGEVTSLILHQGGRDQVAKRK